jgi:multidrug efflux pump subunit AcrA (membrane-fusion protein)
MPPSDQQQLLSEEVRDIISYKPGWLIRRGNFIFLLVFLVLLVLTFIIRHPDIIKASARIAALNAPKVLPAYAEGRLEKLFVINGQQVEKGQRLAYIMNAGKHEQAIQLQKWIISTEEAIDTGDIENLLSNRPPLLDQLGELQQDYKDFQKNLPDAPGDYYKKNRQFRPGLVKLRNKTEEWIQKYIVVSPEAGKLEFASFIQENQLVTKGQELFFVQPPGGYYAEMKAGQNNSGKIKSGQKVIIRLHSYPPEEFGYINGRITYVSGMPVTKDSFLIKVELPDDLQTNYKKDIPVRNNLLGSAEIMTDEKRLIEKLFKQLKNIISW